jgi:hypothetical protein
MWQRIWPDVRTREGAQRTTAIGSGIVFAWAISLAGRNIISGITQNDLVGGVLAAAIIGGAAAALGVAIRRGMRRVAAAGVGMLVAVLLVAFGRGEAPSPFEVIALIGTIYGVRGTFALHRLGAGVPERV